MIAWRISRFHNNEEAMGLINDAIIAEGLLGIDKENLPMVVNDQRSDESEGSQADVHGYGVDADVQPAKDAE